MVGVASRVGVSLVSLVALVVVSWFVGAQAAHAQGADSSAITYPLPGEKVFPEGIAYQESTGDFFVSSTTDGAIYRGNVASDATEVFLAPETDGRGTAVGMALDSQGRLFISGGDTGKFFVYDTSDGRLIDSSSNGEKKTFVNDVTVTPDGSAYFTDSMNPQLYRATPTADGGYKFEPFVNFEDTVLRYKEGFNLNGITSTPDGRYLITVQSNTGNLYRIDTANAEVTKIDTGGADLTNGDGILLDGQTLYVVRNEEERIVPVQLSADYTSGAAGRAFTDDSFMHPTTIAAYDGRLLVVNSQFDVRESGDPKLPFNVSNVAIPTQDSATADGSALPGSGGVSLGFLALAAVIAGLLLSGAAYATGRSRGA